MATGKQTAKTVTTAITDALLPISSRVHTLTYGDGKEFAYHQQVSETLNAKGFFAHSYHS